MRLQRLVAIWRLSGSLQLALLSAWVRCQEVVLGFLRSGGLITRSTVTYRGLVLPRQLFAGPDLAGVGYVKQLGDHGATVESGPGGVYVTKLPNGLMFEATGSALVGSLCMLAERFVADEYAWLDPVGRVVIDVGANIADSVLYFAGRGAKYVYGYEPDPAAYAAAVRNVELNGVENARILPAALVGQAHGSSDVRMSFNEVLGRAKLEYPGFPIVCKIDCEGCEYEILAAGSVASRALRQVTQIMVEYHWRSPEPLVNVLEGLGFQVDTVPGARGVGWIRARKRFNAAGTS